MKNIAQKERKGNICFNAQTRFLLECYLLGRKGIEKVTKRTRLAEIFKCDRKTIYNEIKRGTVKHIRSDLSEVYEYNAEYAQNIANEQNANKGQIPKIMLDSVLAREIKRLIIDKNYSPYAELQELKRTGYPSGTHFCEKTLYNWVNQGLVHGVKRTDLPNKGIKYKEKGSTKRYSRAACARHSIDYRPQDVNDRTTFGHWELDTVKGGKDKPTDCLFTMTERKSRKEIARKIPNAQSKSVVNRLDEIERKIGSKAFRKIFKTLTCDGGSEFMDIEGIERRRDKNINEQADM